MNIWLKFTEMYRFLIWKKLRNITGFTRPIILLTEKAISSISEAHENHIEITYKGLGTKFKSKRDIRQVTKEPKFFRTYLYSISETDTVYDIGAFHGLYGLCAKKANKVFMFEPDSSNSEIVNENIKLNNYEDRKLVPKAVHSITGEIGFKSGGRANSSIQQDCNEKVSCVKIDDFAKSNPEPDLIKIDVEGNELEVLKGAEDVLASSRPDVFVEIHHGIENQDRVKPEEVDRLMRDFGYERTFSSDSPPTLQARYELSRE